MDTKFDFAGVHFFGGRAANLMGSLPAHRATVLTRVIGGVLD